MFTSRISLLSVLVFVAVAGSLLASVTTAWANDDTPARRTYREDREFLRKHKAGLKTVSHDHVDKHHEHHDEGRPRHKPPHPFVDAVNESGDRL